MSYSLVQHPDKNITPSAGNSQTLAFTTSPTSGNLLLIIAAGYATSATFSAISDTIGNTWTQFSGLPYSSSTDGATISMWWAKNKSTAADTVSITCSVWNASGGELYIAEFSGWPSAGTQDGSTVTNQGSSTTFGGSLVTTGSDDLLVGYVSTANTLTVGSPWTQGATLSGDAWFYRADVTAGTYTSSGLSQSPTGTFGIVYGALGATAAAAQPPSRAANWPQAMWRSAYRMSKWRREHGIWLPNKPALVLP